MDIYAGKTRSLLGDAAYLAYPIRYDITLGEWIFNGSNERVLFLMTEQDVDEIQTLIAAYLSGVGEEKIITGHYSHEEEIRIQQAIDVMEAFDENLILAKIPNPNIAQVKAIVRRFYFEQNIQNVFYDYIHSSPNLLNEFRDLRIREDVILSMFSTALKDLASELNIFVASATQVNRNQEDNKISIKNQHNIRGSIAIVDKADIAYIFSLVSNEELKILKPFLDTIGIAPNQVADVYKVRRGRYNNVKIWSYFDYDTCRKQDLFITNGDLSPVRDFHAVRTFKQEDPRYLELLQQLNSGRSTPSKEDISKGEDFF